MTQLPISLPQPKSTPSFRAPWGAWTLRFAALSYLALFILVPIAVVGIEGSRNGLASLWEKINEPVALSAIGLSLWTAAVMAVINTVMGTLTAYVLVTYKFPGKALFNSLID